MGESLREELKKAIKSACKRREAELTVETEALNHAAAVTVKERISPVPTVSTIEARARNAIESS